MAWIADAVPYATIRSSWGNTVRDHVYQSFASVAERDAQAVPKEGMKCWCTAEQIEFVYTQGQWWTTDADWRQYTQHAWGSVMGPLTPTGTPTAWFKISGKRHVDVMFIGTFTPSNANAGAAQFSLPLPLAVPGALGIGRLTDPSDGNRRAVGSAEFAGQQGSYQIVEIWPSGVSAPVYWPNTDLNVEVALNLSYFTSSASYLPTA
jgi:hypothetical protein